MAEEDRGVKFCMRVRVFDYYPDRSSPLLVNFGSRSHGSGITSRIYAPMQTFTSGATTATLGGDSELRVVAQWGIRNWRRQHCLRPFGGICILRAC